MHDEETPLVVRGLHLFCEGRPLSSREVQLASAFGAAWEGYVSGLREQVALLDVFWETDSPSLLRALLPRLEWLRDEIDLAWDAMQIAVDLGGASLTSHVFHLGEPLSVASTARTMASAAISLEPLTDPDRARIRRRRGGR